MSFTNWTRRDDALWLNGQDDVSVRMSSSIGGDPFQGVVGNASGSFRYLVDAVDWCEEVVTGRAVLLGVLPLPDSEADEVLTDNQKFLAERGLSI